MGKLTVSIAIFHRYYQRVEPENESFPSEYFEDISLKKGAPVDRGHMAAELIPTNFRFVIDMISQLSCSI